MSASDPINLVGIVTPGVRLSALCGEVVDVLGAATDTSAVEPVSVVGAVNVRPQGSHR